MREVLSRRGIDIDASCPLYTQGIWKTCNLRTAVEGFELAKLESILMTQDSITLCKITSVLWFVWRARNNVVWRGARCNMAGICKQIFKAIEDRRSSKAPTITGPTPNAADEAAKGWKPPKRGWLKCNVDATFLGKKTRWVTASC